MKLFAPFDIFIAIFVVGAFVIVGAKHLSPFSLNGDDFFLAKNVSPLHDDGKFIIFTDGEKIEIPLSSDTTIIRNSVKIVLQNQTAQFVKSECRNQICTSIGVISSGQIVCVPNRVMVSVHRRNIGKRIDVYAN
jgi:hypothetical protein